MRAVSPRPSGPTLALAAVAALGLGLAGAPGRAETPLAVAHLPELPTTREAVTAVLTVHGLCPQAAEPVFTSGPEGLVIEIGLEGDACPPSLPPSGPVVLELPLGRLPPGVHRLRARLPAGTPVEHRFTVYSVSSLLIDLPEDPISSDEAATFTLVGFDDCPQVRSSEFRKRTFTIEYLGTCPGPSPGPSLFAIPFAGLRLDSGVYRIRVFDIGVPPVGALVERELVVHEANGCVPGAEVLCLQANRFRVEVEWRDFTGRTGRGQAVPLSDRGDTGLFWFFDEENVELTVKVLFGCGVTGRWWVFLASGSTVEYTVTVTDTRTGAKETYSNALGQVPELISDTAAFACP